MASDTIRNIVILTGAGISAEAGLATFRDAGGLWEGHRPEDVATPEAFARDPDLVQGFYNARRRQLQDPAIRPNAAHLALARLEREWPGEMLLVTQNVDDLHERAGSAPLHMHGSLTRARCIACAATHQWLDDIVPQSRCPACAATGALRPDIVWFGEMPMGMGRIERALEKADLFIAIGTSGLVYPAAGFVRLAVAAGARAIEFNLEPGAMADAFHEHRTGPATRTVPAFVDSLLAPG